MSLAPGSALGPYTLRAELGRGGMGEVYRAHDTRLDRDVAVKVLPAAVADDPEALARFEREAKAIAALSHPNVLSIYDVGRERGVSYVVTELLDGDTLRVRLEGGALPPRKAIAYATQLVDGLAAAHARGIVHRDLKPENVFITRDDRVKLLDFGLALVAEVREAGPEAKTRLDVTRPHTVLGTVGYMSPEQVRGERADARSDLFAFGVVLYEMLTGRQAFAAGSAAETMSAVLRDDPAPLIEGGAPVPGQLDRLVRRCLEKVPDERFQSARDLSFALATVSATAAEGPSIAVLPFTDLSREGDQEYFCDGLAEELIDALARLDGLRVVARTSSFQFRDKGHDLRAIGERLRAKTVLEGSVRTAGSRLRVNAQLIDTEDGYHLWSQRYDRTMDDVFAVQDEIAQAVVRKLEIELLGRGDAPLVTPQTDNLEAYNLVLKGRHHLVRLTGAAMDKSLECYRQALALEPDYAQAHAGIAQVQAFRPLISLAAPHEVMPQAKAEALTALALDETVAEAHFALALVHHWYEWNWADAERTFRRALALGPGDAFARSMWAHVPGLLGRADESVAEARAAARQDPLSPFSQYIVALMLIWARRYDEAMREARAGLDLDGRYWPFHLSLGMGLAGGGQHDDAVEAFRHATSLAPADPVPRAFLAWAVGLAGQRQEAVAIVDDLERQQGESYAGGMMLALASLGTGDTDRAIRWLEQGADERDGRMTLLNAYYFFDPLRDDPRFQALLRRLNL